ncbi:hypothetical protein CC2G_000665 [Coprinopsis cinerea AmutBmut pab1-1]|nr:hypothetical protein CC2G_000665 [Coprinopsis cinerea AmutBmut pab1-1]
MLSDSGSSLLDARGIPPTPDLRTYFPVYLALHIAGGHVGLPVLVATCLCSKSVLRHPTLVNFFTTWIIHSVASCLLLYSTGLKAIDPNTPPGPLCLAQSALLHGTLPMCATATLVVVIQAWSTFRQPELANKNWSRSSGLIAKLVVPYIVFFVYTTVTAVLQHYTPEYVNASNGLYCTYYKDPFRRYGVTVYCIVTLSLILLIELAIGLRYFFMWKHITTVFPLADRSTSPAIAVRLTLFNVYSIFSLATGITFVSNNPQPWPYIVQAGMPLAVALVFGCQKDYFLAWCFWKKKRKDEAPECTFRCRKLDSVADLLRRTPSSPSILLTPSLATKSQNDIEVSPV